MNKMQLKRLAKLTDFLRRLRDNKIPGVRVDRFSMNVWKESRPDVPCGTVACAAGHIPDAMPRSGFVVQGGEGEIVVPRYKGKRDTEAVEEFFGLEFSEVYFLFMPRAYYNPVPVYDDGLTPVNYVRQLSRLAKRTYFPLDCPAKAQIRAVVKRLDGFCRIQAKRLSVDPATLFPRKS